MKNHFIKISTYRNIKVRLSKHLTKCKSIFNKYSVIIMELQQNVRIYCTITPKLQNIE